MLNVRKFPVLFFHIQTTVFTAIIKRPKKKKKLQLLEHRVSA